MKLLGTLWMVGLMVVLTASTLAWSAGPDEGDRLAQARPERPERSGGARPERPEGGRPEAGPRRGGPGASAGMPPLTPQELTAILGQLNLTAEQKTQVDAILAAHQKEMQALQQEMAAVQSEMQTAREGGREQMQAVAQKMQAVQQKQAAAQQKLLADIAAVLNPEQKAKFEQLTSPAGRFARFVEQVKALDLTAEQTEQVDAAAAEAKAQAEGKTDQAELGRIYGAAQQKILVLLTPEQKVGLQRARGPGAERPQRDGGERPQRDGGERPQRDGGERPQRGEGGERPQRGGR